MRTILDEQPIEHCFGGVLVPTMGALHQGHAALIREARRRAEPTQRPVVVSIFVNPAQFNDHADYERYHRNLDDDARCAQSAGADCLFAPSTTAVYPGGQDAHKLRTIPRVAALPEGLGLEDASRPGHFAGVCAVIKRLFELTKPTAAVLGEKDWQQLQTVRALNAQRHMGVEIVAGKTVREADGVAASSRNRFLTHHDRARARAIPRALRAAGKAATPTRAEAAMRAEIESAGLIVEYAAVRDAITLLEPERPAGCGGGSGSRAGNTWEGFAGRALVAARTSNGTDAVRLLDNAPWPAQTRHKQ